MVPFEGDIGCHAGAASISVLLVMRVGAVPSAFIV